jgi:hypothetical protein
MTIAQQDFFNLPGTATRRTDRVAEPPTLSLPNARLDYVRIDFQGMAYWVPELEPEPDPAASLAALIGIADNLWGPTIDSPDLADAAEARSQLTRALYLSQLDSISQHDA